MRKLEYTEEEKRKLILICAVAGLDKDYDLDTMNHNELYDLALEKHLID